MITKIPKISSAQAKRLASAWANGDKHNVSERWNDPTTIALKTRGLIEPTGATGKFPSGTPFVEHQMSLLGKGALADFLWKEFVKERDAT